MRWPNDGPAPQLPVTGRAGSLDAHGPALLRRDLGLSQEPGRQRQAGRHPAGRRHDRHRRSGGRRPGGGQHLRLHRRGAQGERSTRSWRSRSSARTAHASWSPAAWPSATAPSWPRRCPRSTRWPASACRSTCRRRNGSCSSPCPGADPDARPAEPAAARSRSRPWAYVKIAEGCDRVVRVLRHPVVPWPAAQPRRRRRSSPRSSSSRPRRSCSSRRTSPATARTAPTSWVPARSSRWCRPSAAGRRGPGCCTCTRATSPTT